MSAAVNIAHIQLLYTLSAPSLGKEHANRNRSMYNHLSINCYSPSTSPERRSGDRVAGDGGIRVEQDTGVSGLVQVHTEGAPRWNLGARAGDLNVDAERVRLGAVGRSRAVGSDGLVAEDVRASLERLGHGDGPRIVVVDHLLRCPFLRAVVDSGLVNLGPEELGLVDGRWRAAVGRDVGQHGTQAVGPCCPLELDGAAGADGSSDAAWGRVYVAVDVLCSEFVGLYEAEVGGFLVPVNVSASLEA